MHSTVEAAVTIAVAIIGVASLALIVSRQSNTSGVVQSLASGLGNDLAVAESPVTGTAVPVQLGYPGESQY